MPTAARRLDREDPKSPFNDDQRLAPSTPSSPQSSSPPPSPQVPGGCLPRPSALKLTKSTNPTKARSPSASSSSSPPPLRTIFRTIRTSTRRCRQQSREMLSTAGRKLKGVFGGGGGGGGGAKKRKGGSAEGNAEDGDEDEEDGEEDGEGFVDEKMMMMLEMETHGGEEQGRCEHFEFAPAAAAARG